MKDKANGSGAGFEFREVGGGWRLATVQGKPADAVSQIFLNYDNIRQVWTSAWRATRLGRAITWIVCG